MTSTTIALLLVGLVVVLGVAVWLYRRGRAEKGRPRIPIRTSTSATETSSDELRRFGVLLGRSSDIISVLDSGGRIRMELPSGGRILGYEEGELLDRDAFDFLHPEDRPAARDTLERCLARPGHVEAVEVRFRHADGHWVSLEVLASNLMNDPAVQGVLINARDLTERRRLEQALRESERRLATLVSNLPGVAYRCRIDPEWTMEYLSEGCLALTGYPARDFLDGTVSFGRDLVHEGDRDRIWQEVQQALDRGEPFQLAYRLVDAAGKTKWVWEQGRKVESTAREPVLEGFIADISARVQAEEALRESEERYRTLIEASPDGIIVYADGTIVFANEAAARLVGSSGPQELIGIELLRLVPPELQGIVRERIRRLEQEGGPLPLMEQKLRRADGELVDVEVTSTAFQFGGRRAIQAIWRDIRKRRQAEAALKASEERYRRLFEDSRDAIFISTPGGRLVEVNQAAVELFGYDSRQELLEVDIATDLYQVAAERETSLLLLRSNGFVQDLELRLRRKDGAPLTVLETATTVHDAEGKVVAVQGILRDVTAQRELEQQLRQAQTMEAVGVLAGSIAHDFNNMITTIAGYTDLLLAKLEPESALRSDIEELKEAGRRAAQLTRQLLALSRRPSQATSPIDLNEAIRGLARSLGQTAGDRSELVLRLGAGVGRVKIDPAHLAQVLTNLIENSRDAMPDGGRITISTRAAGSEDLDATGSFTLPPGGYVLVEVQDEGVGIPDEIRHRIFEPFFSTKETSRRAGLSLATVYSIVHQAGGDIRVESSPGVGSAFRIFLPPAGGSTVEEAEAVYGSGPERTEARTILLVEDEEAVRELVRQLLTRLGYTVVVAADGLEAMKIYHQRSAQIDLVLTDLVIPGIDGIELAKRLREEAKDLKVLMMSGYSDALASSPAEGGLGAPSELIRKPFTPDELADKVREVLGQG